MWFENLLVFILFKCKKCPNISGIRIVYGKLAVGVITQTKTKTDILTRNAHFKVE